MRFHFWKCLHFLGTQSRTDSKSITKQFRKLQLDFGYDEVKKLTVGGAVRQNAIMQRRIKAIDGEIDRDGIFFSVYMIYISL